ncbi:MAG: L-asparaginase 1, partial [Bacteroidota bacterium]|nr:L-asparaginase 1 [Bacteroidota bacterium]
TEAAITKMMFLLGSHQTKDFKLSFETSIRGELTKN